VHLTGINRNAPYYYYSVFRPEPDALDEFKSAPVDAKNEGRYNFFKSSWTITSAGDAAGYPATNAIDGDDATVWRSSGALPQTITIDMKSEKSLSGFYFLQVQGTDPDLAKDYTFETSTDGDTWTSPLSGEFTNSRAQQTREFAAVTARFFRFTITSSHGASVAQAAEINFFNEKGSSGGRVQIELLNAKQPFDSESAGAWNWWAPDALRKLTGWTHSENAQISWSNRDGDGTFISVFSHPPANMGPVNNAKVYQTVNLGVGKYELTFYVNKYESAGITVDVFGVAAIGNTLPDYEAVSTDAAALGHDKLSNYPINTSPQNIARVIEFTLSAAGPVTIGWVYNINSGDTNGWVNFRMSGIDLYKL
jgi:hypothetical protein